MNEEATAKRWQPTGTTWLAGTFVIGGSVLAVLFGAWFLLLVALGTFGPGVLREAGWLRDKDELQLQAAHRAGYHAYVTCGIAAFVSLAYFQSGAHDVADSQNLALLFLALLWCTWVLSALLSYWGPRKTAARILTAVGVFWLALMVFNNLRPQWSGWPALFVQSLPAVPLFVLAWTSPRWPRTTGVGLLALSAFTLMLLAEPAQNNTGPIEQVIRVLLFFGPLLACGVSLLTVRRDDDDCDDADEGDRRKVTVA
jgi:hypothetical protein